MGNFEDLKAKCKNSMHISFKKAGFYCEGLKSYAREF